MVEGARPGQPRGSVGPDRPGAEKEPERRSPDRADCRNRHFPSTRVEESRRPGL